MTIRVDREGLDQFFDGVGIGSTGGGIPISDDGSRPEPWQERPWGSRDEGVASEVLQLMAIPSEQIRALRPPVPYQLFPDDRYGYDTTPLTIEMVLDTNRWAPQRRSWVSPDIRPYRRVDGAEDTSASMRNVSPTSNPMG